MIFTSSRQCELLPDQLLTELILAADPHKHVNGATMSQHGRIDIDRSARSSKKQSRIPLDPHAHRRLCESVTSPTIWIAEKLRSESLESRVSAAQHQCCTGIIAQTRTAHDQVRMSVTQTIATGQR